jgi:hypothetical protein
MSGILFLKGETLQRSLEAYSLQEGKHLLLVR